jgi:hypothetical protein
MWFLGFAKNAITALSSTPNSISQSKHTVAVSDHVFFICINISSRESLFVCRSYFKYQFSVLLINSNPESEIWNKQDSLADWLAISQHSAVAPSPCPCSIMGLFFVRNFGRLSTEGTYPISSFFSGMFILSPKYLPLISLVGEMVHLSSLKKDFKITLSEGVPFANWAAEYPLVFY